MIWRRSQLRDYDSVVFQMFKSMCYYGRDLKNIGILGRVTDMRFTKSVIWKNRKWRIKIRKRYKDKTQLGELDWTTKEISSLKGLNRKERLAVILHEFCHLVAHRISHDITDPLCDKLAELIDSNNL